MYFPRIVLELEQKAEEIVRRIAAVVFAVLLALPAAAQKLGPAGRFTLISPYAPGGASDFLARTLAEALKARLASRCWCRNAPGAGGTVGTLLAAKARPDGYTLL